MVDNLLMGLSGITETKIFMLDKLIEVAKDNDGFIGVHDLEYIKKNLIEMAKNEEINDALNLMEEKFK